MSAEELRAWLHLLSAVSRAGARRLLARHGSPQEVLAAGLAGWAGLVKPDQADALQSPPSSLTPLHERTLRWLHAGARRSILTLGDEDYPPALLHTADPPLMLMLDGRRELLARRSIAIVGSRRPTPTGREHAHHFAAGLGEAGFCIVSGLALGIDGAAHEAALHTPGGTIAVLGCGLDQVYPLEHADLARHVAASGLMISEFFIGTPPMAPNFPQRNRIIAGLSEGCLVVEAALKSGSLITARLASEAGREVFAVPGPIRSPQSRGCHQLLKQGACLVQELDDLLNELPAMERTTAMERPTAVERASAPTATQPAPAVSGAFSHPLLRALGEETMSLEALSQRSGWAVAELSAALLDLELEGHVTRLPGARVRRAANG